jgi:hypothetical protein
MDDIAYINADGFDEYVRRASALLKLDPDPILKALPSTTTGDDFVSVPVPQLASSSRSAMAEALAIYEQEKTIVDARLQYKITLGEKRISFASLCEKLTKETGIEITASRSVSDEKITVFCKDKPVRDLLRQVTRLFGFVWERSGKEDSFTYKLTEPLKVKLLEEELRNQDRNEALLALERAMDSYKSQLSLSPDEARSQLEGMPNGPAKDRLKKLGGIGWGPMQLYQGLSSDERDTLLKGGRLNFGDTPGTIQESMGKTILDALRGHAFIQGDSPSDRGVSFYGDRDTDSARNEKGKAPGELPDAAPFASLELSRSELGEFNLMGSSGFNLGGMGASSTVELAKGISPSAASPENAKANATKKNEPAFQKTIALDEVSDKKKKLTTADLLEAIHKATGKDIVGDYFTRLYDPAKLFGKGKTTTFDALNRACDNARLRWEEKDGFVTFRSTDFFNMRLKEVPNRLMDRWSQLRKEKKTLTAEELREISRLTDFQLDASGMTQGATELWGLDEWQDVRSENLRPVWRFFDSLPAPQRARMLTEGLSFGGLGLDAQQKFLGLLYYSGEPIRKSLEEGTASDALLQRLARASLLLTDDPARLPRGVGAFGAQRAWNLVSRAPAEDNRTRIKILSQSSMSSGSVPGE